MLILSRADLERLLSPADVVGALADAFRDHARDLTIVPPRGVTRTSDDGLLLLMPAVARGHGGAVGTKLVTYYAGNRTRGAPTIHATYVLLDAATGAPVAVLEGTYLTALRTGSASALAARYLARPASRRIVCFGAGAQAAFQLRCLANVLPVARVDVVGRDLDRARRFTETMARELGVPVAIAKDAREAVHEADVVTCATTSSTPVLFGDDLRAGTHVDAVGAFRPDTREVDSVTVRRARVVVDTYAGALAEAGDLVIPLAERVIDRESIHAELAELVTGAKPGRESAEEITLFKSVGFALEDLATARLAWQRAREQGLGTEVAL